MKPGVNPQWLATTIDAVREVMQKRLDQGSLDDEERREAEMALEELEVMWEELQGQALLLRRESARYSDFFEHAPDAYLITDAGGNVREANLAAVELLGKGLAARPIASLVSEAERVSFLSRYVGALGASGTRNWQARVRPVEGEPFTAQFSVRSIPLGKSGALGLCWLVRPL